MPADAGSVSLQQAISRFLLTLQRPITLVVAVSGGSDSTGLLVALQAALKNDAEGGIELLAATIDHALRAEAAGEAAEVGRLCADLGIAHVIRRWEDAKPSTGISAAAREARYRLLTEIAMQAGAAAILTGHTADDQRETVFMRSARAGSGNLGLSGMAPAVLLHRKIWLMRPVLDVSRQAIRSFLTEQGRGWIDDPSNADAHYERVRVRHVLTDAQPDGDTAAQAAMRRSALSDAAADLAKNHLSIARGVLAFLPAAALDGDPAVRRHLLGLLAAVLGGRPHLPASESMDRVMAVVDGGAPGRITAGRVIFDRRREGLFILREARSLQPLRCGAGAMAIWDGRFELDNRGGGDVTIGAMPADHDAAPALFPGVPASIAMRAMAVMPRLEAEAVADPAGLRLRPVLAPFDRFLPQFELSIANAFAALVGCNAFPAPPVKLSARKT